MGQKTTDGSGAIKNPVSTQWRDDFPCDKKPNPLTATTELTASTEMGDFK